MLLSVNSLRAIIYMPLFLFRASKWGYFRGGWVTDYIHRQIITKKDKDVEELIRHGEIIDIMVIIADHFEPPRRFGYEKAFITVKDWCDTYRKNTTHILDADGKPPKHTWFYRADYKNLDCLKQLCKMSYEGFGEVEYHLHHGYDDFISFQDKIDAGLKFFNNAGAMLTAEGIPRRRFAYIAGNWSLDNGALNPATSGCNTELLALREMGCYADFTFPAIGSAAQPSKVNSIYWATDDPRPKSYDKGIDLETNKITAGDLVIFQGPLSVVWSEGKLDTGAIETYSLPSKDRLPLWLDAHIHVKGRPEWIFVKLHTHSVQSKEVFLSSSMVDTWKSMVACWNKPPFRLHFVTAREAYNIARAAEAGKSGDPGNYRDFEIPVPACAQIFCNAEWHLEKYTEEIIQLMVLVDKPVEIKFRNTKFPSIKGIINKVDISITSKGEVGEINVDGREVVIEDSQNLGTTCMNYNKLTTLGRK